MKAAGTDIVSLLSGAKSASLPACRLGLCRVDCNANLDTNMKKDMLQNETR